MDRRSLFALAVLAASVLPAHALTVEEIVDCRIAVERVLYERRSWPEVNPDPKPAFESLVSRADVLRRVNAMLRRAAMQSKRGTTYDADALQNELSRMASNTRDPELLGKLFAAAGDGERAAWCLALPDLVARERETEGGIDSFDPNTEIAIDARDVKLTAIEPNAAKAYDEREIPPDARYAHTATWTGVEMVVFGGSNGAARLGDGARYLPATDSWVRLPTGGPSARFFASAVWTGLDVVIYGGTSREDGLDALATGARYRPTQDVWGSVSGVDAPLGRYHHVAVWTGTSMIVFSGIDSSIQFSADGGSYTPANNSWTALPAPPAGNARSRAVGAWTGSEMVVWGGFLTTLHRNDGLRYVPGVGWSAMSTIDAPAGRGFATGVWFGAPVSRFVVWGGEGDVANALGDGGLWNPGDNTWTAMSTLGAPTLRKAHTAVAAGNDMLVWGGTTDFADARGDGARFSPATNTWLGPIESTGSPVPRSMHSAVWTGDTMIVWGGRASSVPFLTGGRYSLTGNAWQPTWRAVGCDDVPGNLVPRCGFEGAATPGNDWTITDGDTRVYRGGAASGFIPSRENFFVQDASSPCFPIQDSKSYDVGVSTRVKSPATCYVELRTGPQPDCGGLSNPGPVGFVDPEPNRWQWVESHRKPKPFDIAARVRVSCSSLVPLSLHLDDAFVVEASDALFANGFE
jgi:hypothetical protein